MIVAALLLPLFQLLLFAYAISFDVRNLPTVVIDQDKTPQSRAYINAATHSGFFHLVGTEETGSQVDETFNRGVAHVAILIRQGFGSAIASGGKGQVAVLIDGSEPNSAQIGRAYATALNQAFSGAILAQWIAVRGGIARAPGALEPRIRTWYNPNGNSAYFLVPGLMVVIIMIVTIQQTAVTLVKERENGTLEQLMVSPLRRGELVVGKIAPWAILGFVDTVFVTAVALVVFRIPLRGDLGVLAVGMFFFVLDALALGLIVSAVAPTLESANMAGLLVSFLPAFMLSGMAFPLASIPAVLQWLSYALPGRYMVEISRGVFLRGSGWGVLGGQVMALAVFAVVALGIATLLLRRQLR